MQKFIVNKKWGALKSGDTVELKDQTVIDAGLKSGLISPEKKSEASKKEKGEKSDK